MGEFSIKGSEVSGIRAIYCNGELVYEDIKDEETDEITQQGGISVKKVDDIRLG